MTWATSHKHSEELASGAHVALRAGDRASANRLFAEAAKAESEAMAALDKSKTRTLGITAVSAVSLWFKAQELAQAERLALDTISGAVIPQFAMEQLKQLLQSIWNAQALKTAGVSFLPGQVMVSVKGGDVISGGAPMGLVLEKVQTVQAMLYRTIEHVKGLPHRLHGPPTLEIQQACRPWLLQAPAGSYQFAVAIQEPAQLDFFEDVKQADRMVQEFISIVKASSEDPAELDSMVTSPEYKKTFLKLSRNLAPTGRQFDQLEIRKADEVRGVVLGPENRKSINRALKPKAPASQVAMVEQAAIELTGTLRAVDLTHDWLEVLTDSGLVRIASVNEEVDDVIGPLVNRPVIIRVRLGNDGRFLFEDIENQE